MKKPMVDTMKREKFDDLNTPDEAIFPLLKRLPPRGLKIWEPCDSGNSNIAKIFRAAGDMVISSDIKTGFDFLTQERDPFDFDMIITNPPYSQKDAFLERCFWYKRPFALLLPLTALEGVKRGRMFHENGISVIVLARRIDFTGKGRNWFNASWFTNGLLSVRLVFEENK